MIIQIQVIMIFPYFFPSFLAAPGDRSPWLPAPFALPRPSYLQPGAHGELKGQVGGTKDGDVNAI